MGAENDPSPTVGESLKGTQDGSLPIGTVQAILEKAPSDLKEEIIEVPAWGCSLKIRSFTAAQAASIKESGFAFRGEETAVAWAEMEIKQFQMGVIEPRFGESEVRELYNNSGSGFAEVLTALDALGNIDKEALAKARDEFQRQKKS